MVFGEVGQPSYFLIECMLRCEGGSKKRGGMENRVLSGPTDGGGKSYRARMPCFNTGDRQHACPLVWPIHIFAWIRIGKDTDH